MAFSFAPYSGAPGRAPEKSRQDFYFTQVCDSRFEPYPAPDPRACLSRNAIIISILFRIAAFLFLPFAYPSITLSRVAIHSGSCKPFRDSFKYGWIFAYWKYIS